MKRIVLKNERCLNVRIVSFTSPASLSEDQMLTVIGEDWSTREKVSAFKLTLKSYINSRKRWVDAFLIGATG